MTMEQMSRLLNRKASVPDVCVVGSASWANQRVVLLRSVSCFFTSCMIRRFYVGFRCARSAP